MITCLGFAAGFGSVWRFPYLVYKNGGGAFLLPYFTILFIFGIPVFFQEIALGQTKGIGLAQILKSEDKKYRGFGYVGIIISAQISTYYNLIMAYSLMFLYNSFKSPLPWDQNAQEQSEGFSRDYFYKDLLNLAPSITDISQVEWPIYIAYLLSLMLVYFCIKEGIEQSGKIALVTATSPYVLLLILLIRGITLEGAKDGIYYLLKPDFVKFFDPMVWVDATNQIVFQMSIGQAILVLYGSYREKTAQVTQYAFMIPILTAACGLLAALVVFSYIGHVMHLTGLSIQQLPLRGPDLAFVLYPAILTQMPWANFWCILFFIIMILLGIDTQFAFVEGISGTIEDIYLGELYLWKQKLTVQQLRLFVCMGIGLVGIFYCTNIGFHLLHFVDIFGTNVSFMLGLGFQIWYFSRPERSDKFRADLAECNLTIPSYIEFCLRKICPYLIIGLTVFSIYSQIMDTFNYSLIWALIGWSITFCPFALAYYLYRQALSETSEETEMMILK
ncbi:hypothetical protein pb186bvf_014768 [Paramecium bursaria]